MTPFEQKYLEKCNRNFLWSLVAHLPVIAAVSGWYGTGVTNCALIAVAILAGPVGMLLSGFSARAISYAIAIAAMSLSGVIIHASRGMTEFHFHIFVMIALLIIYGSPRIILTGAGLIAVQHLSLYFLLPSSVFSYQASLGIVALHATFVVVEAVPAAWIAYTFGRFVFARSEEAISEAVDVLEAICEGDLTRRLEVQSTEQVDRLCNAINRTVISLQDARAATAEAAERENESREMATRVAAEQAEARQRDQEEEAERKEETLRLVAEDEAKARQRIEQAAARRSSESSRIATQALSIAQEADRTVANLGSSSAEIGSVVKLITNLARRTNLLALNATIEAARAGEAGKGFSVVAREVKELAKETTTATEDITQRISAIQSDTGQAVSAIRQISGIIGQIHGTHAVDSEPDEDFENAQSLSPRWAVAEQVA